MGHYNFKIEHTQFGIKSLIISIFNLFFWQDFVKCMQWGGIKRTQISHQDAWEDDVSKEHLFLGIARSTWQLKL